ncbi:MAG: serine hydrolase [Flaviflexus sp.]|nr:serine hydrolase [Flaviflexus sp.]
MNSSRALAAIPAVVFATALVALLSGLRWDSLANKMSEDELPITARAVIAEDLSTGKVLFDKNPDEKVAPASLAKLFAIDYASTMLDPGETIAVTSSTLDLVKPGSSMAGLVPGTYSVENLYAAMLLPSGNDAANALAAAVADKISPDAADPVQRQRIFLTGLAGHLRDRGYLSTNIDDPCGYDTTSRTTPMDVAKVTKRLLTYEWFREMTSAHTYSTVTPGGVTLTWQNTNFFLDPNSAYYIEGVTGVKTGSLGKNFNLVTRYQGQGRDLLIVSLGSPTPAARYDDAMNIVFATGQETM